ncbi:three-Cys-motif partner protein TcmP [Cellulomonas iranensis]|uniref:three-Cys-motif partner protein TcmP n=1 Tax=Cellulomonas iranensis TaxID=76862 RepID=UPI001CF503D0|nr:three-Cys-motif partner protein TcmP [Cellulomonas iranensis]UCN14606.1 three-Cys-motif partner protein TcmP [Cellulomonas iranensis]
MPKKREVPWGIAPHTQAKHRIYEGYLRRWFPILLSKNPSVTYAEGFSGPGVYTGGEPGSPIIAVRALLDQVPADKLTRKSVMFVFTDDDQRCVDLLNRQFRANFPRRPLSEEQMPFIVRKGRCDEALGPALKEVGAWGHPILAVLDSWGNVPVGFDLIRRVANNRSSEVIVTFLPEHFLRFVTDMGPEIDDVFGGDPSWREVQTLTTPAQKIRFVLTKYREMLKRAGFRYILDFEMVDTTGTVLYLVFGTTSELGLEKMKDTLWEVDPLSGMGFRDPRDVQAETLDLSLESVSHLPLQRLLRAELERTGPQKAWDLAQFTLFETVYRPKVHALTALRAMRDKGWIVTNENHLRYSTKVALAQPQDNP